MAVLHGTDLWGGSEGRRHSEHRMLRAERAQLQHWRRLLRARLDLAVAGFAPPEDLGAMHWELLPEAQLALPTPQELNEAVCLPPTAGEVELMERLRALDRRLAAYGAELDAAIEASTHDLVDDLAGAGRAPRDDRADGR